MIVEQQNIFELYFFVIGLMKLPPSDAKVKVTFPTIPNSLSNVTRYLLSHQGFAVADAVVVSSIVTANAVHNTFFFIIFHLLIFVFTFSATQTYHRSFGKSTKDFAKALFFD